MMVFEGKTENLGKKPKIHFRFPNNYFTITHYKMKEEILKILCCFHRIKFILD